MGSLQAHESRINRSIDKNEEKALQVKETTVNHEDFRPPSRGRGRSGFRGGRGRGHSKGRGRGRNNGQRQFNEQSNMRSGIQCYHCNEYGHIKANSWYKDQQMNFAVENEEAEEEERLFMACIKSNMQSSNLWFGDSDCSNHMTGIKSLFHELDETQKIKVQLGNAKEMQVEGKGAVKIETSYGKVKMLNNVQFVLDLGYNLLSVRQLMAGGNSVLFDDNTCVITNKKST